MKESVAAGLAALIDEHHQAIEAFGSDTRPDTLERVAERIKVTRFKVESYAAYLSEEKARAGARARWCREATAPEGQRTVHRFGPGELIHF